MNDTNLDGLLPVFESSALKELFQLEGDGFNRGLVAELMVMFLRSTPPRIAEIVAVASEGNVARTRQLAHILRTASANLGALRFSNFCAKLERVQAINASEAEDWARLLHDEFGEVRIVFEKLIHAGEFARSGRV